MSMEIMLRYIVGIAIAYSIGKWIYQSIRSRSIDFFYWRLSRLWVQFYGFQEGFLSPTVYMIS